MAIEQLFYALGDPTRLKIVRRLSSGSSYTIGTLSLGLPISRQGARKHLQILAEANVIVLKQEGRNTSVHLNREALERGKVFIAKIEKEWDDRLEALRRFVDDE